MKLYQETVLTSRHASKPNDQDRELYMARRLKELSLSYDSILIYWGNVSRAKCSGS